MLPTVQDWIAEAKKRSQEQFRADFPCPFLIGSAPLAHQTAQRGARTLRMDLGELQRALEEARASSIVLPLRKRLATFPSTISFGRTANNDLVLDDPQISKFHASFRFRDDAVELEDGGSANGSYVGGVQLAKNTRQIIKRGDVIRFGSVSFELYDADGAWAWLTR